MTPADGSTILERSQCYAIAWLHENFMKEPAMIARREDYQPEQVPSEDCTLALMSHVGGYFTSFLVPLILWLVKKDGSRFVDLHAREALNYQVTMIIYYTLLTGLGVVLYIVFAAGGAEREAVLYSMGISFLLMMLLFAMESICVLLASIAAYRGKSFRYPFNIRVL